MTMTEIELAGAFMSRTPRRRLTTATMLVAENN